jgi:hypothetical protein
VGSTTNFRTETWGFLQKVFFQTQQNNFLNKEDFFYKNVTWQGLNTDDTVYAVVKIKYLSILLHTPVYFVRRIAHHAGTFPKPPPVLVHQRVLNDL